MDRRSFLKRAGICFAGTAVGTGIFRHRANAASDTDSRPVISMGENKDYSALVKTILEPLGGISKFVKPGSTVVIKPNIGWDRKPEHGANTHPEVIKALVLLALTADPKHILVFDRTCNDARLCYASSGIQQAVESIKDARVEISFIDDRKFVPVKIIKGQSITEWDFYKDALDADCYINVPVAKQHGLSRLSLGMKNIMGVIGGVRGKIHMSIGQRLADLNSVLKPKLTVIDATRLLLRNGPQGGSTDDVKLLHQAIASTDPVAADAYATTLFDLEPAAISSTLAAYQMGLGEIDVSKMHIMKT
jgi:uncharacterized protein (DUF362 family)